MCEEFQKAGIDTVTSTKGFTVEIRFAGGIIYRDAAGRVDIDSEWLAKPLGIVLYKRGPSDIQGSRLDSVISNAVRALEYLGHRVEVWSSPSG
jgi:hypothetical protein